MLIVASSRDAIVMVEGGAKEVTEDVVLDAIFLAQEAVQPLLGLQLELQKALGKPKRAVPVVVRDEALIAMVQERYRAEMREALTTKEKQPRQAKIAAVIEKARTETAESHPEGRGDVGHAMGKLEADILRRMILDEGRRIDGRSFTEVRPIQTEVGWLPRAHGSALFTRGETQSLGVCTLGTSYDDQRLDTLIGANSKAFMLHYNFPPYCTG